MAFSPTIGDLTFVSTAISQFLVISENTEKTQEKLGSSGPDLAI
jgi:hypothetical protein